MSETSLLIELNQMIDYYISRNGYRPTRILLGYKSYTALMLDQHFAQDVINSALDPNKRKYKKLKIKVTKDDHQLELE
ncbi:hypothetical protein [Acinetobacter colistiniresistens]|uniref:Uncharacterized protein n=1 Tax=Acinetobacter colistiniresistens TaxID=280145 RepID=S3TJN9_9GAMM|nr:hypothetical protein [Acinetobacter colistiniresistens]EPG35900.1 hypothetical protein F907_02772 [Acinetobacter colistiniresistens]TVT83199.1 hypothetical protein FPV60_08035 [Acinetobacter colistiniresistens]